MFDWKSKGFEYRLFVKNSNENGQEVFYPASITNLVEALNNASEEDRLSVVKQLIGYFDNEEELRRLHGELDRLSIALSKSELQRNRFRSALEQSSDVISQILSQS
jgi:hypothetical protein